MPSYKILPNGKAFTSIEVLNDCIEYEYGNEPQELLDAINFKTFDERYSKWKAQRNINITNIEIEYNGKYYHGDEISQDRMMKAIRLMEDDATIITVPWKAKDKSINNLTYEEIKSILKQAGLQMISMWNLDMPTE